MAKCAEFIKFFLENSMRLNFLLKKFLIFLFFTPFVFSNISFGNLLNNPGFEDSAENFLPWQKHPTAGNQIAIYEVSSEQKYTGNYSLKISSSPNGSSLRNYCVIQPVSVFSGKSYKASVYVYSTDVSNGVGLIIKTSTIGWNATWPGVGESTYTVANSPSWQYLEMSTKIPQGVSTIYFHLNIRISANSSGTAYFDDAVFEVIPPGKITGFIATQGMLGGEINLSWVAPGYNNYTDDLPTGSTFYIQYSSMTEGVVFSTSPAEKQNVYEIWIPTGPVQQGANCYYTIEGLKEGLTYYFRIWVMDNAGNWSEISDGATTWAQITPLANAPTDLSVTSVSSTTISLSWSLSNAATYWVERSSVAPDYNWIWCSSVPHPGTSYTDIDLTPGTTYWYRLIAVNSVGVPNYETPSNIVSSITYTAAPLNFTTQTVSVTSIVWIWTPVGYADKYRIYMSTSPETLVGEVDGTQTTFEEQYLSTNTAYGRFVRAYNIMGESLPSNHATFYTLAVVPTDLQITEVYSSSVTLVWNGGGNPDWTRYGVAVSTDNFETDISTKIAFNDVHTNTIATITNLDPATTYYFRVWAYNGDAIESPYTQAVSTCTLVGSPAAPTGFHGIALSTVSIKWEWNITKLATYYQIYDADTDTLLANLEGNGTTTWIEIGLSSNTQYSRYVKAGNEQGLSEPSDIVSKYTLAYPPTNLTATAISSSTIELEWNYSGATKYQIWRSTVDSQAPEYWLNITTVNSPTLNYQHENLLAGVTYYYKIVPVNAEDEPNNDFDFPYASTRTLPSPVVSFEGYAVSSTSIKWEWVEGTGADGYKIYNAENGSVVIDNIPVGTTYYIEDSLNINTQYKRYIRAFNTSGVGEASVQKNVYTFALPPESIQVEEVYISSVSLSWSSNNNPSWTRYGVAVSKDNFETDISTKISFNDNHTQLTATLVGLEPDTTYYFRVWAYNGDGIETTFVSTKTTTLPIPVKYLKIVNPSYELPTELIGWTKEGTASSIARSSTYKRTGNYSCKFDNPTSAYTGRGIVSSSGPVSAGSIYKVGAYFFVEQKSGNITDTQIRIGIRWIGSDGNVIYTSTSTDLTLSSFLTWEKLTYSATAPVDAVQAVMIIHVKESVNNDNDVYVDDVLFEPDTTPPAPITNLTATKGLNPGEIVLSWTAVGDDGYTGNNYPGLSKYILKYSTFPLVYSSSWSWYNNAIEYYQEWEVGTVGSTENKTVVLSPGVTYYFLIRTVDAVGNISEFDVKSIEGTQAFACAKEGALGSIVRINEINCNKNPNWIELYNASTYTIDVGGWEIFEVYESTYSPVKTFSSFPFSSGTYIVLYFGISGTDGTEDTAEDGTKYYKFYTGNSGITSTDNGILLKDLSGNLIDAVFYTNSDGSLSNKEKFIAAYNYAISNNQWTGSFADGNNDIDIEKFYTASSKFLKSGRTLARDDKSTDGTNPSKAEWHVHAVPTPGEPTEGYRNRVPDTTPPGQITDLVAVSGDNRGTIKLSWTTPGEDGYSNQAELYIVRYSPNIISTDEDFDAAELMFNDKSFVYLLETGIYESITWKPTTPGTKVDYALGSLTPGVTYYIAIKTEDEQPLRSLMSNVVSAVASSNIGSNIRINEIAPRETNDWIELYNPTEEAIDLSGWEICNNIEGTDISGEIKAGDDYNVIKIIPNGFILPPKSYAVLNLGYVSPQEDEITADINNNGYLDLYATGGLVDTDGIIFIRDKNKTFVDAVIYSDGAGSEPSWTKFWKWVSGHRQWSPAAASQSSAADWSSGAAGKSIGRDRISSDTDDTLEYAKNDWKVYTKPTKGIRNDDIPPAAISDLVVLTGDTEGSVILRWSSPADDDGYLDISFTGKYVLKYSSVQIIKETDFDTPSFVHDSVVVSTSGVEIGRTVSYKLTLEPGVSYWFAIKSTDTAGNTSVWKSSADVSTININSYGWALDLPPAPPSNLTGLRVAADKIDLSWDFPEPNPGDIDGFRLYYSTNNIDYEFLVDLPSTQRYYNHTGLNAQLTYYYKILCYDKLPTVLSSEFSSVIEVGTTVLPPPKPIDFYGIPVDTDTILWQWKDTSSGEIGFKIYTSTGGIIATVSENTTFYVETNLLPNRSYTRYVKAFNTAGESEPSNTATRYTYSAIPSNLKIDEITSDAVKLSWSSNGNPDETKYGVSYSSDSFELFVSTVVKFDDNHTNTFIIISALSPSTLYTFRVWSYNEEGLESLGFVQISTTTLATGQNVVISQFATRGPSSSTDEFIELYNPTLTDINISGWKLQYKSASDSTYKTIATLPSNAIIKAKGYYLIASSPTATHYSNYASVPADFYTYSAGLGLADNGHIRLGLSFISNSTGPVAGLVDKVGYGSGLTINDSEGGEPAPNHGTTANNQSVERKPGNPKGNSQDTDNNAADFKVRERRMPRNSESPKEPDDIWPDYTEPVSEKIEYKFTHGKTQNNSSVKQKIIELINSAQSHIYIAMYNFTDTEIISAINLKASSGVIVRIVLDDYTVNTTTQSLSTLVKWRPERNKDDEMHHKFMIIDGKITVTGSANFTLNGLTKQHNHIIIIESTAVAKAYEEEFKELWWGYFKNDKLPQIPTQENFVVDNIPVNVYMSPQDQPLTNPNKGLAYLIKNAKESVFYDIFSFTTGTNVDDELLKARDRGVIIQGVHDKNQAYTLASSAYHTFDQLGMSVRLLGEVTLDTAKWMHNKLAVIDGDIIVSGSINWTDSANSVNDENMIVIVSPKHARQFIKYHKRLYKETTDDDTTESPSPDEEPPQPISGLKAYNSGSGSIGIEWSRSTDPGFSRYYVFIREGTTPIQQTELADGTDNDNDGFVDEGDSSDGNLIPEVVITDINQTGIVLTTVNGRQILDNVTYYIAVTQMDKSGNESLLVTTSVYCFGEDKTPPAKITDLVAIQGQNRGEIILKWTSVGDDGHTGVAYQYEIYYATYLLTAQNYSTAEKVANPPKPYPSGNLQSFVLSNLSVRTTYYFVMRTADEKYNWSEISNLALNYPKDYPIIILIDEGFEGDDYPPTGWIQEGTERVTSNNHTPGGKYSVKINHATDYIITPLLINPVELTFWLYATAGSWLFYVEYSTSVNGPWNPLLTVSGEYTAQHHEFKCDLSEYKNIYLKFKRGGARTYYLDDIKVLGYWLPDETPPAAISNLTALSTNIEGAVLLRWTSPGDDEMEGKLNDAIYRIKCSSVNFTMFTKDESFCLDFSTHNVLPGTKVEYLVSNLKPGTTYYFGIIVRDDSGNWSTWRKDEQTNTANYAWALDSPPLPPTQISAVSLNRAATLYWQYPDTFIGDIDKYWIYLATFSFNSTTEHAVVHVATVNFVSYPYSEVKITGLINGVSYYFRIKTIDKKDTGDGYYGEALESELSDIVSVVPRIGRPSGLKATHYTTYVVLSWEHSPDFNADNFAGYRIYRSTDQINFIFISSTTKAEYKDEKQIDKKTTYYYYVCTVDTTNVESEPSNIAEAIPDFIVPNIVLKSRLTSRDLAKDFAEIKIEVVDDRFKEGDGQGKLVSLEGKYRVIGSQEEHKIEFDPSFIAGVNKYTGKAKFDFRKITIGDKGIEYQFIAKDEVNTAYSQWEKVIPPEDKPEQKFITPTNPEVVFGKDVEEVIIYDQQGNKVWEEKSVPGRLVIWRGVDKKTEKFVESGAYIYQIKTKDGKFKYGVVIVVK